jgi:hypothetical protein
VGEEHVHGLQQDRLRQPLGDVDVRREAVGVQGTPEVVRMTVQSSSRDTASAMVRSVTVGSGNPGGSCGAPSAAPIISSIFGIAVPMAA